jgi:biopolymer transport protein ExbD
MAGAPRGNDSNSPIAEINVIPLVDIILVVLIIFMVAAPLVMKPKIDISLPKSTSMDLNKDKTPMRVVLGKKGENPAVTALLVADKDATLAMITDIVDSVKTGGVGKVAFSIQKK